MKASFLKDDKPLELHQYLYIVLIRINTRGGDNMDINSISTLISNIGVPCACLIATFYLWQKESDSHKEEMSKITDALNNNTLAITKLTEHIMKEAE
jgi:hypothetical protein